MRDQVSHSYKTIRGYSSVYFNPYVFIQQTGRQKLLVPQAEGIVRTLVQGGYTIWIFKNEDGYIDLELPD